MPTKDGDRLPDSSNADEERRRLFFRAVLGGIRAPHVPEGRRVLFQPGGWKALAGKTRRVRIVIYAWMVFGVAIGIFIVGGVASGNGAIVAYVLAGLVGLNAAAVFATLLWLLVAALFRGRQKGRA